MDMDIDQTEFAFTAEDPRSSFGLTLPDPQQPATRCQALEYFIDMHKLCVTWTIPNGVLKLRLLQCNPVCSHFYGVRQLGIVSPEFTEDDLPVSGFLWTPAKPRWKIVLKPLHRHRHHSSPRGEQPTELHISLLLDRVDTKSYSSWNTSRNAIDCTYRFDILDPRGESISSKSSAFRSIPEGLTVGWSAFESYDKLLEKDRLGSDLVIKCTIQRATERSFSLGRSPVTVAIPHAPPAPPKSRAGAKNRHKFRLTTALRTLKKQEPELRLAISKKKLKIVCAGQEFLANAEILAARSAWFRRYFEADPELFLQEPGIIPRLDTGEEDPKLFRAMLQWLCKGTCGLLGSGSFQDKLDLFELAMKYDIEDLSEDAMEALVAGVELGNVVQLYFLFSQHALLEADSKPTLALRNFILNNRHAVSSLEQFQMDPRGCRLMFMTFLCWGSIQIPMAEEYLEQFFNFN